MMTELIKKQPARAVVDIVTGTWRTQALYAAVALRLPDHITEGHTTSADLAAWADADPDAVIRLMHLLTAFGVFGGNDRTGYELTPVSDLLRSGVPSSMRDMCLMYGEEFHRAWGSTATAVRTGRAAFEDAFGRTLHEYLAEEPRWLVSNGSNRSNDGFRIAIGAGQKPWKLSFSVTFYEKHQPPSAGPKFLRAMNAGSVFFADVPTIFDFTGCRTVTDLAGGNELLLSTVLSAYPGLHSVLFDLKHMVPVAEEHLASTVGRDRYDIVVGDFFESVPVGSDAYLLSRILEGWDVSACITLLNNVRRAMPDEHARLFIVGARDPRGRLCGAAAAVRPAPADDGRRQGTHHGRLRVHSGWCGPPPDIDARPRPGDHPAGRRPGVKVM
jgi:hypothetical protein